MCRVRWCALCVIVLAVGMAAGCSSSDHSGSPSDRTSSTLPSHVELIVTMRSRATFQQQRAVFTRVLRASNRELGRIVEGGNSQTFSQLLPYPTGGSTLPVVTSAPTPNRIVFAFKPGVDVAATTRGLARMPSVVSVTVTKRT